ncbi:unnamed protein product [Colias eurytheme]|nr:unnamed protein product [Colias eurytheme]
MRLLSAGCGAATVRRRYRERSRRRTEKRIVRALLGTAAGRQETHKLKAPEENNLEALLQKPDIILCYNDIKGGFDVEECRSSINVKNIVYALSM